MTPLSWGWHRNSITGRRRSGVTQWTRFQSSSPGSSPEFELLFELLFELEFELEFELPFELEFELLFELLLLLELLLELLLLLLLELLLEFELLLLLELLLEFELVLEPARTLGACFVVGAGGGTIESTMIGIVVGAGGGTIESTTSWIVDGALVGTVGSAWSQIDSIDVSSWDLADNGSTTSVIASPRAPALAAYVVQLRLLGATMFSPLVGMSTRSVEAGDELGMRTE